MKKLTIMVSVLLLIFALNAKSLYVLNSGSQTVSLINLDTHTVNNNFCSTGLYANQLYQDIDSFWIVNSGDNNAKKISLNNGSLLQTIQLENSANPWNLIKKDNYIYITGLMTGKLYRFNTENNQQDFLEIGFGSEGMLILNNKLYVANTGYQYPNYVQGTVSVINLDNFTKITDINVETNPQALILGSDNNIHVVCTGDYVNINGKVCIINPENNSLTQTLDIGTSPNNICESPDHKMYLADGNGAGFIVYDAITKEIINSSENLLLPGVSKILFDGNNKIVVKTGDWESNSTIQVLNQDNALINSYSCGVGAIDILMTGATNISDYTQIQKPDFLNAYPNPFKENINIKALNPKVNNICIYNVKGEKINEFKTNTLNWNGNNTKGVKCSSGIYFVVCKVNNQIVSKKTISLIK